MGTLKYSLGVAWVPVRTAASSLGCSRQRIYALCQEGKLMMQSIDGTVLVSVQSIDGRLAMLGRKGG